FALARYNADGSLDTSFDSDGRVTEGIGGFGTQAYANALAIQPDGKIVVVGKCYGLPQFFVARFDPDGQLDASFGAGGIAVNSSFYDAGIRAMEILADGRILVAGSAVGRLLL